MERMPKALHKPLIYQITNLIDGKFYIGVASAGLPKRRREHLYAARHSHRKDNRKLYNAMRKHGVENFGFDVICECDSWEDALKKEIELIASMKPQYNLTAGGQGVLGLKFSAEARAKLSMRMRGTPGAWLGKKRSQEDIEKMRAAKLENPTRYWLGKKRSQSTNEKISKTKTGVKRTNKTLAETEARRACIKIANEKKKKPVICVNDGLRFGSAKEASLHYGLHPTTVASVAGGRRKAANGLRFVYVDKSE